MSRDKTQDIEFSLTNSITKEMEDMPRHNYPKTRKKNRADPNTRKCPGATFRNKERVFKELRGEG